MVGIKRKPMNLQVDDIESFRSHDPEATQDNSGMDARISKTVRMRQRFSLMLKEQAYHQSMKTGQKVSEADLLDEALADWRLKMQLK